MKYKEDSLQISVATYLDYLNITWCHVANERKTSLKAGARLKNKGVKSGVPDCVIFEPKGTFNGLALELKIKPNTTTDNQKEWLKRLSENNWRSEVAYSFDEAKIVIDDYLKL